MSHGGFPADWDPSEAELHEALREMARHLGQLGPVATPAMEVRWTVSDEGRLVCFWPDDPETYYLLDRVQGCAWRYQRLASGEHEMAMAANGAEVGRALDPLPPGGV